MAKSVRHFYVRPLHEYSHKFGGKFSKIEWEFCYNAEIATGTLSEEDEVSLQWLMNAHIFDAPGGGECVTERSRLSPFTSSKDEGFIIEVGPRYDTPFDLSFVESIRRPTNSKWPRVNLAVLSLAGCIFKPLSQLTLYLFVELSA